MTLLALAPLQMDTRRVPVLDLAALRSLQLERLRTTLHRVYDRVPHYRRAFDEAGMGQLLGPIAEVGAAEIAAAVTALVQDGHRRRQMRKVGLSLIDGEGAARIAADLAQALKEETRPRSAGQAGA